MAFVDGNIGWLAQRSSRVMQPFGHIAQLYKFLKVINRCIAATTF